MKALYVLLIAVLLAGCGPSAEQMTATGVAAQAQTQTAAPTWTPTLTPTPTQTPTPTFTATPIFTPTLISAETIVTVPYAAPIEGIPSGLPPKGESTFFTSSAGFVLHTATDNNPWTASFTISLEIKELLPDGARVEVLFENPLDPTTAIITEVDGPFSEKIFVVSPDLTGIECRTYWIEVHVYSDPFKTQELGSHLQWTRSAFNLNNFKDIADMFRDTCKN